MSTKSKYYDGIYELRKKSVRADSSTTTLDLSDATFYDILLEADTAIVLNNPLKGVYTITIDQTAAFTVTWPANVLFPNGIYTGIGSVEDKKSDVFTLIYDGTNFYASQESNLVLPYLLDNFQGAAAAYSLRNLTSDNIDQPVVRVRRSSDNAEANFIESEITDGTLEDWVNTEVVKYTSDFSATEDLSEFNGTGAANIDGIAGVDDTYRFTLSGGSAVHDTLAPPSIVSGISYTISGDYYIPSSNSFVDVLRIFQSDGYKGGILSTVDAWTSFSISWTATASGVLAIRASDGGSVTINADGDVFYLKNIVITQTTADGHVTTWHDQAPKEIYKSDFTSGNEDLVETLGTATDGVSIGGENNVYEFTADGTVGIHKTRIENLIPIDGRRYRLKLKYYLPSSNAVINRLNFLNAGTSNLFETTTDQWVEIDVGGTASISNDFDINMYSNAVNVIAAAGDKFYLKDIEIYGYYDAKQTTAANQPKIVNAGALVTENGKPSVDFDGVNDYLDTVPFVFTQPFTFSMVHKFPSISSFIINLSFASLIQIGTDGSAPQKDRIYGGAPLSNTVASTNQRLYFGLFNSTNSLFSVDGNAVIGDAGVTNGATVSIGKRYTQPNYGVGKISEVVVWDFNQSTNRTDIESNINTHYNIY